MARYHGKNATVYMSATGAVAARAVASMSKWTLNLDTDFAETTSFLDVNKTYVAGLKDVKGTLAGFWDDTESQLFDGSDSDDGVLMYLYPSSKTPAKYFYGPAFVTASIEVDVNGAETIAASFNAKGAWGRK